MPVTPIRGIRSELDPDGRLVRAFIPSATTPGREYEMVRAGDRWVHADRVCPAWMRHLPCAHIEALMQLDQEAGRAR